MKFWPVQLFCTISVLDGSIISICTMPFVRPTVPVSFTVNEMVEEPDALMEVGLAVAEVVNASAELTVMDPAEEFMLHCCPVALDTMTSTV